MAMPRQVCCPQRFANSESRGSHRQIIKVCSALSRVLPFQGPAMMGRAPRQPVDLQAVTNDVKAKIRRGIGELEASSSSTCATAKQLPGKL